MSPFSENPTQDPAYAARLARLQTKGIRKWIDVQIPYRLHLRHLRLGFVLEIGAGIGRNLLHLKGNGVGVDHNAECVKRMQQSGLRAFLPEAFLASSFAVDGRFDALLFAHVLEHMDASAGRHLVESYLRFLKTNGRVVAITPQENGFDSDPTHVAFIDGGKLSELFQGLGLKTEKNYSFPFPRWAGRFFTYNEFIAIARKP